MTDLHERESTFLAHLDWMRRTMAAECRRRGTMGSDAEDFASWATLRLIEDDYAILRQFRGESAIRTYLVVVIAMLHREYRVRCWGRWRASAAARRAGPIAVRLETLVHRDGYTLAQAILSLRTAGATALSDRQLVTLFAALPRRSAGRVIEQPAEMERAAAEERAEDLVLAAEAGVEQQAVAAALDGALAALPHEDRLLVRLRFWDGLSVADIARQLLVPQKPLYRRLERALATLRRSLEGAGLSPQHARSFLERAAA